jgi:hypothetical protein
VKKPALGEDSQHSSQSRTRYEPVTFEERPISCRWPVKARLATDDQGGDLTRMTPCLHCEISRALLASNPMERREGPCFPLEIAALSLNRLRATPLCSENAPPSGVVREIQRSLIPSGPRSPATCRKWDAVNLLLRRPQLSSRGIQVRGVLTPLPASTYID